MQVNRLIRRRFLWIKAIKSRLRAKIELRRPRGISLQVIISIVSYKEFPDEIPLGAEIIEPSLSLTQLPSQINAPTQSP